MKSAIDPLPEALRTVNSLSITNVNTIKKQPINIGTIIPPSYILEKFVFGPLWLRHKQTAGSEFVIFDIAPTTKRHITYPAIIQSRGASHDIMLLDLFARTDVVDLTVSAM